MISMVSQLIKVHLLAFLVSKIGDAELGEVEDNLLELKNFSITYKTDSSKLASTTSTGSA